MNHTNFTNIYDLEKLVNLWQPSNQAGIILFFYCLPLCESLGNPGHQRKSFGRG